ncbi:hypothetical protein BLA29_002599 [Euroglyphus maynei]|uniref:Protein kinase domain-containing protein n=1 Tax=Euroglyphus maynei TaxID=6958 RepID=A0A1Y3AYC2_EURMA|nr:hypothetical protein BLA29_002599 [Euroglyphus maynei]
MALKIFTFSCFVIFILLHVNFSFKSKLYNKCSSGQFRFASACYSYLDCNDVQHMNPIRILARGTVKNVWLIEWNHQPLVMSTLTMNDFKEDFQANIANLIRFRNENHFIIELFGVCGNSIFTPYYSYGDMNNLPTILNARNSSFNDRLSYCISYVKILNFLHTNSMVMCDSNDLAKTLSQYLITNDDRLIVMNDLDALPQTTNGSIKCGHRPIFGEFAAPEQRHPNTVGYDHKTDIWKVPDPRNFFSNHCSTGFIKNVNLRNRTNGQKQ